MNVFRAPFALPFRAAMLGLGLGATAGADEPASEPSVFRPTVTVVGESWRAVDGGVADRTWWNALVDLRGEYGSAPTATRGGHRLVAQVHAVVNSRRQGTFADDTGAFNPVSGNMATNHVRVYNVHYRYDAPGERWALKLGQIAADDDFMLSDYAALFANAAFGAIPTQVATPLTSRSTYGTAFGVFPVAVPGFWWTWNARGLTWQTGLYHGGPGPDSTTNTGFHYGRLNDCGLMLFTEVQFRHHVDGRPATSRFGVCAHNGKFDDLDALADGRGHFEERGLVSLYVIHDIALVVDADQQPVLGGFVRLGASPQRDRSVVTGYGDAGLNWFGPVPARPKDVLGLAVSRTGFSSGFERMAGVASTETIWELTYQFHLGNAFSVQANAQRLTSHRPNAASNRREVATVLGLRTLLRY